MRHLTSDFILTASGDLVEGLTLKIHDDGTIISLETSNDDSVEYFPGILCPGFINCHLHLELSGFQNKISRNRGLDGFISELVRIRNNSKEISRYDIKSADDLMWINGIQGAGDICNTHDTLNIKQSSKLRYHNFIEVFEFNAAKSEQAFNKAILLESIFKNEGFETSIVPHAPYSVPPRLFDLIAEHAQKNHSLWTIHNQESESENLLFQNNTGALKELFSSMGIAASWQIAKGVNSIISTAGYFPRENHLMLVHNTFTSGEDIVRLMTLPIVENLWFCLCPNANIFIENRLPDIDLLRNKKCRCIIGTDSLASNDTLNILEEIITIQNHFPHVPVAELLMWATSNAADYFKWNDLGRFIPGKRPGIISLPDANPDKIKSGKINRLI